MDQHNTSHSGRRFPSSGFVGFFSGEKLAKLIPYILIFFVIFILCSLLIWPFLISSISQPTGMDAITSDFCRDVAICGGIGCALSTLVICIRSCMVNSTYTLESSVGWCFPICLAGTWIAMICFGLNLLGPVAKSGYPALLNFILMGVLGLIISIIPSFISVFLGAMARVIRRALLNR